jgi:uncharacterized protein DUF5916/cellulose/xylan binding protein with CBM9 domain
MIKLLSLLLVCFVYTGFAQTVKPEKSVLLPITEKLSIDIDGKILENEWANAVLISDFIQREPDDGKPVSEKTKVYLLYDADNLYIAFRCWDNEPDKIIANVMRRDEWLLNNDCIEIFLDTYHDHRNAFYFSTNPLGAQRDGIITAELPDDQQNWDWNGVWDNASSIDSSGWTAEFSIPFKTLRFDDNDTLTWGVNFSRCIPRKREEAYWAPISRDIGWTGKYRVSAFGNLFGLKDIKHPEKFEFKPYLLTGFKRDFEENEPYQFEKSIGIDAKYHITPNLNMDISINTDFAQVESDQEQINLSRFELFLPEKREFFLEGANIFRFGERHLFPMFRPSELFFSRRIGISDDNELVPVLGGIKMTGKIGKINTGFINILTDKTSYINDDDEDVSIPVTNYTVLRLQNDLPNNSNIGIIGLNQESLENPEYERSLGIDGNFFVSENSQIGGYIAKSFNPEYSGKDMSGNVDFLYNDDLWNFYTSQSSIQNNFSAETGFFPRTGIRRTNLNFGYSPRPDIFSIRQITIFDNFNYIANQKSQLETRNNLLGIFTLFNNGSYLFAAVNQNYEKLDEEFEIHDNIILPDTIVYRFTNYYAEYETDRSKPISGLIKLNAGEFFNGDIFGYGFGANFNLGSHLSVNLNFDYNDIKLKQGNFSTSIFSSRIVYSFTPKFFIKPFIQWNSDEQKLNTNFLLNFIHKPGSDIYFVYNEEFEKNKNRLVSKNRAILLKITHLMGF